MMKRFLKLSVLAVALAGAGVAQAATSLLLTDLLGGSSITAGDKVFDSWTLGFGLSTGTAASFDSDNIRVTSLDDGGMDPGPGLFFEVLGGQFNVTGDGTYSSILQEFGFRVSAPAGKAIKDVSLAMASGTFYTRRGDNGSYVGESVGTAAGLADLGYLETEWSYDEFAVPPDPTDIQNPTDSTTFAGQSSVWITKTILVWASDVDETAGLTGFTQRFSQENTGGGTVPTPATLPLVALAALGAFASRRRTAAAA